MYKIKIDYAKTDIPSLKERIRLGRTYVSWISRDDGVVWHVGNIDEAIIIDNKEIDDLLNKLNNNKTAVKFNISFNKEKLYEN